MTLYELFHTLWPLGLVAASTFWAGYWRGRVVEFRLWTYENGQTKRDKP